MELKVFEAELEASLPQKTKEEKEAQQKQQNYKLKMAQQDLCLVRS